MTVSPIAPADAPALVVLAAKYGQETFMWSPGSAGVAAREEGCIHGFALLCARPYGHIVEELWCAPDRTGHRATAAIMAWVESIVPLGHSVGGIVREGTPLYAVLRKRGYAVSAHVLVKDVTSKEFA